MGTIIRSLLTSSIKKAATVNPQDFITQDNVTTIIKLAGHVVKLLF